MADGLSNAYRLKHISRDLCVKMIDELNEEYAAKFNCMTSNVLISVCEAYVRTEQFDRVVPFVEGIIKTGQFESFDKEMKRKMIVHSVQMLIKSDRSEEADRLMSLFKEVCPDVHRELKEGLFE